MTVPPDELSRTDWNEINEKQDQIPDVSSEVWPVPCVSSGSVAEEVIIIRGDEDFPDLSNADSK